jgi:hypothetical protein
MRKLIGTTIAVVALAFTASVAVPATSFAAPTLPEGCTKVRGQIICTQKVGKAPAKSKAQECTTTSRGNLTNKKQQSGPGKSQSTSACK